MANFLLVSAQVAILFVLIAVGVLCRKLRWVDEFSIKGMVNVLILVVTPSLIIDVFQRPFDGSMLAQFAIAFAVAALMHILLIVIARMTSRGSDRELPVLRLAAVFSNAGFMGIPLENAILGPKGVFFGIVYVAMFNLFMWSWGLKEMTGSKSIGRSWRELRPMLINPGTVGILVGLPLFLFSVSLPPVIREPISMLSDLNTPLAMIVIGYYLAGADLKAVIRQHSARVAAFVRLVVSPVLLVAALWLFRSQLDREMMLAMVIAASAPSGAMVTMFASKYDRDVDLSVGLVSGTTILSVLTMPPVIALAMGLLN